MIPNAHGCMTAGGSLGEVTATPKPPTEEEKRAAAEALQKAKNAILNRGNYAQGMQEINKADAQLLGSRELKEMETLKLKMEPVAKIFRNLTGSDKRTRILRRAVDKYIADDGKSAFDAVTYAQQLWPEDRDIQQLKKVVDREFPQIASQEALVPNLSLVDQRLQEALELIYVGRYVAAISLCQDVLELEPNNVMPSGYSGTGISAQISVNPSIAPSAAYTLTFPYRAEDIVGLTEDKLTIAFYDTTESAWSILTTTIDKTNKLLTVTTTKLGIFTVMTFKFTNGKISGLNYMDNDSGYLFHGDGRPSDPPIYTCW